MLQIEVPGTEGFNIQYLVLDYNGTIALNGQLLPGVKERVNLLAKTIKIYVLTADTYGTAKKSCADMNVDFVTLQEKLGTEEKEQFIVNLGWTHTAAVGNGMNDHLMLKKAALGIAVIEKEGTAVKAILSADAAVNSINDALDLFIHPKRLTATLRL